MASLANDTATEKLDLLSFWDSRISAPKDVHYHPKFVKAAQDEQNLAVRTLNSYRSLLEFFTYEAVGLRRDHDYEYEQSLIVYREQCARFIRVPGPANANTLVMLIREDIAKAIQLRDEEAVCVRIHRLNDHDVRDDDWYGTLSSVLPNLPATDRVFFIQRPYDDEKKRWCGRDPVILGALPSIADIQSAEQAATLIDESIESFAVDIRGRSDTAAYKRQCDSIVAVAKLVEQESKDNLSNHCSATEDILCANDFDRLPLVNFLQDFTKDELEKLIKSVSLGQRKFVEALCHMPGGFTLVQGCAGAGKSHVIVQVLVHYILHLQAAASGNRESLRALVVTPINTNADGLCRTFGQQLHQASIKDAVVIRKYSKNTDRVLMTRDIDDKLDKDRPRVLDLDHAADFLRDMTTISNGVFEEFARRHRHSLPGDRRVKADLMDYSLSAWIRLVIRKPDSSADSPAVIRLRGAIPSRELDDLQSALADYEHEDMFRAEERKRVTEFFWTVVQSIYRAADVVVCTVSMAASTDLTLNYKPRVFVIDEAAKVTSVDGLGWGFYRDCRARILVGDTMQALPRVSAPSSVNPFAAQLGLAFFTRLRRAGFPSIELLEQHRFGPAIAELLSIAFYDKPVTCALKTLPEVMRGVDRFHGFSRLRSGKETEVMLLAPTGTAELTIADSKFNTHTAAVTWQVIDTLLKYGYTASEIGIVTPYTAQRTVHENIAHARVAKESGQRAARQNTTGCPARESPPAHNFMIETFERAQSLSRDIILVDIPNTKSMGFLSEPTRLCTGLSRVRFGLIIVMDVVQVQPLSQEGPQALSRIIRHCKRKGFHERVPLVPEDHEVWSSMPNVSVRPNWQKPTDVVKKLICDLGDLELHE